MEWELWLFNSEIYESLYYQEKFIKEPDFKIKYIYGSFLKSLSAIEDYDNKTFKKFLEEKDSIDLNLYK